ncbi:MAG TPA: DUF998 domain-containing protein [Thermoplasmata archaeon]|jgi:hypothetical membrane protein
MGFNTRKLTPALGLLAVAWFLAMYSVAMSLDSVYVFGENYLSDLGVGEGAWAFNSGVIGAGVLFILFGRSAVAPALGRGRVQKVAVSLLVLAAAFLVCVGIFTEDAGDLHGIVSYGFFLTMLVALGVLTWSLMTSKALGRSGAYTTLAVFIFGIALLPMGGDPLSETLAVLGMVGWGALLSALLLLKEHGRRIP